MEKGRPSRAQPRGGFLARSPNGPKVIKRLKKNWLFRKFLNKFLLFNWKFLTFFGECYKWCAFAYFLGPAPPLESFDPKLRSNSTDIEIVHKKRHIRSKSNYSMTVRVYICEIIQLNVSSGAKPRKIFCNKNKF